MTANRPSEGTLEGLFVAGAEGLTEDLLDGSLQGHAAGMGSRGKKAAYVFPSHTFRNLRKMS